MIAHLKGPLLSKHPEAVIIGTGGVGYEVHIPLSTFYVLPDPEAEVSLHIHTHVREDAILLYGFHTLLEKRLFGLLNTVSGIGPKLAVNILSGMGPRDLLQALGAGNTALLQAIPGVGKKTAERMVVELKERALKVQTQEVPPSKPLPPTAGRPLLEDALSALVNLGYPVKTAKASLERLLAQRPNQTLEQLIMDTLRGLAE